MCIYLRLTLLLRNISVSKSAVQGSLLMSHHHLWPFDRFLSPTRQIVNSLAESPVRVCLPVPQSLSNPALTVPRALWGSPALKAPCFLGCHADVLPFPPRRPSPAHPHFLFPPSPLTLSSERECLESKLQQTSNRTSGLRIRNRQQRRWEAKETESEPEGSSSWAGLSRQMLETRVKPGLCPGEALVGRHKTNVYNAVCDKRMLLFEEGQISDTQRHTYLNKLKAHQREI